MKKMFIFTLALFSLPVFAVDPVERIDLSFGAKFLDWSDSSQVSDKNKMEDWMNNASSDLGDYKAVVLGDKILKLETFQWLSSTLGDDGDCLNIHAWLKRNIGDDLNKKKVELVNKINETRKAELENLNTIYKISKIDPLSPEAKTTKVKFFKGIPGKELEISVYDFLMGTSNNGNGEYAKVNTINNTMNKEIIEGITKYYTEYKDKLTVLKENFDKMKSDGTGSKYWEVGNSKYTVDGVYKYSVTGIAGTSSPKSVGCHGSTGQTLAYRLHRTYILWGAANMGTNGFELAVSHQGDKEYFKNFLKKIKGSDSLNLGRFHLVDPLMPRNGKFASYQFEKFENANWDLTQTFGHHHFNYMRSVTGDDAFEDKLYAPFKPLLSQNDNYFKDILSLTGLSQTTKQEKLANLNLSDIPSEVRAEYQKRIAFVQHPIIPFDNIDPNKNKYIVDRMSKHLMGALIGYSYTGRESPDGAQKSIIEQQEDDEGVTRHRYVQSLIEDLEIVQGYFKNFKINDNLNNNTADLAENGISPGKETNYGLGNTASPVATNHSLHSGTIVDTNHKAVELPGLKVNGLSTSSSNIHELLKSAQARLGAGNFASAASGNGAFGKLKKIDDKSTSLSSSDSSSATGAVSRSLASVADHGKSGLSGAAGTGSGANSSVTQASSGVAAAESEGHKNTDSPYASKDKNGALAEAGGKGGPALKWKESGTSGSYTTNNEALDDTERERVLASVDKDKAALTTGMGDNLFDIVSKTYKRNLGRVLVGDSSSVQAPEKAINTEKKAELNKMLDQF